MRLAELQAAGRHPQLPLRVTLADGAGAALGHFLAIRRGAEHAGFDIKVPERHRWRLGTVDQQTFGAPLGVHRME
ncbi:hypothetical protein, partial [Salmonella sp. E393-2]|uniref:hypothetical protein n=1 Tax=Salmonella sp. E393-2 TaxID=3240324 RepID=UPI00352B7D51